MGDFSRIKNVAKYAARLGLCFSSTPLSLSISPDAVSLIPDIQNESYVFSDGVGKIARYILEEVMEKMNL